MTTRVELTWYRSIVLLSAAFALAISITNLYYFNKIRLNGACSPVSEGTATTMIWLNLVVAILSGIAFFWSLFRLIFNGEDHDVVNQNFNLHTHLSTAPDTVVVSPPISPTSPLSTIAEQGYQV